MKQLANSEFSVVISAEDIFRFILDKSDSNGANLKTKCFEYLNT